MIMTAPQPTQCQRCGHPVLPDTRAPGVWVDQYNGRFCGGNPQTPHVATWTGGFTPMPSEGMPPRGSNKKPLIFGGIGLVLVLVIGVVLALVLTNGSSDTTAQASSSAPPPPPASSSAAPPADPYAPVPCDPDKPGFNYCFPPKTTGTALIEKVRTVQQWKCFKKGEKDAQGNNVSDVGFCQGSNTVDQPFIKNFSIGYDTENFQPSGTMNKVNIVASTGSRPWKNEQTDPKKTSDLAVELMDTAFAMLWPDNKDLQKEANDKFKELQPKCESKSGASMDDLKVELNIGYVLSCGAISTIQVGGDKGVVTSITETMNIEIPLDGPKGK